MDADRAAQNVDALPVELRQADLAAVLGVTRGHIEKMRGGNRVPKPNFRVVWLRESIRAWLIERLVNREADLAAALKSANTTRSMIGHNATKRPQNPLFPFLGIGD